ncbi:glycosyltransferase 87 family protein [Glaciibacter flavus]|uniref:glycosyltransferase 87 family protein n=1 Tax=Orlajensenia flava TaxID=2565934 RepID=UPI003B00AF57
MTADRDRTAAIGWARSPLVLWIGLAAAHAIVIIAAFLGPGIPLGDVTYIYPEWVRPALDGGYVVGIDGPWVYPIVAIIPLLLAGVAGIPAYGAVWLGLVIVFDAVAFGILIGWGGRPARRHRAAWWWLAFIALLGPISLSRIDAVTVPLAIVALLFVAGRPRLAAVLLAIATWIKVWPAALIGALVIASRRRMRVLIAVVGTSAAIVLVALVLGAGANVFSFIGDQTERDLQIEAPASIPWLWLAAARVGDARIFYDHALNTFEVAGAGTQVAAAIMTPLLAVVVLAVAALGVRAVLSGGRFVRVFPPLALGFVMAFIAVNKVGSPQYLCWIAAPVILGLLYRGRRWRAPATMALVLAGLTQVIYPFFYGALLAAEPMIVAVLTLRNLLEVVLLVWCAVELWSAGSHSSTAVRRAGSVWKSGDASLERAAD